MFLVRRISKNCIDDSQELKIFPRSGLLVAKISSTMLNFRKTTIDFLIAILSLQADTSFFVPNFQAIYL